MEMNDILNGLNSCDDDCCDSNSNNCSCGSSCCGPNFGGPGIGGFPGGLGGFGPGFGFGASSWWIWILLILFYCGCGKGGYGRRGRNACCCEPKCCDCCECCCEPQCCDGGRNRGGLLGNCAPYLFLLVILFLCNSNLFGFSGCGLNGLGRGIPGNDFSCGTSC